jgi:serine phosphatase RsbU (regulator of sigma subunit)
MNPDDQQYGTERTVDFIRNGPSTPERLVQELVADVRRHAAQRPQTDDITVLAFGREMPAA